VPSPPRATPGFAPYKRDPDTLARPWAVPGTAGLEHRIGGLEKQEGSGLVTYDAENHRKMVELRARKIEGIARDIPLAQVDGDATGELLIVGWGSTHGAITAAVKLARAEGRSVSHLHLRHLNPLPSNVGDTLRRFRKVLVPENNLGQLCLVLRSRFLVDARPFPKVEGRPFLIREIRHVIEQELSHA
jgi:2-oxoglutarate/2-oxoacid ferredoxin oxidoreductase subunit alpha